MSQKISFEFKLVISVISVLVAGVVLWGGPSTTGELFERSRVFGVFLLFLAWLSCMYLGGLGLTAILGKEYFEEASPLVWGSLFYLAVVSVLGFLGLLGTQWLIYLLMFSGLLLFLGVRTVKSFKVETPFQFRFSDWSLADRAAGAYFCFELLMLGARSFRPQLQPDSIIYHLNSPRLWWDIGKIVVPKWNVVPGAAGYWEQLLIWGAGLFSGPFGTGAVEIQFFSQWVCFSIGCVGTLVLINTLLKKFEIKRFWRILALCYLPLHIELYRVAPAAMTDWPLLFFFVAGVVGLLKNQRYSGLFAGLMFGTALGVKLVILPYLVLTMSFYFVLQFLQGGFSKAVTALAQQLFGALLLWLPMLERNYCETGSPLFPWFNGVFQSRHLGPLLSGPNALAAITLSDMPRPGSIEFQQAIGIWLSRLKDTFGFRPYLPIAALGFVGFLLMPRRPLLRWFGLLAFAATAMMVFTPHTLPLAIRWISTGDVLLRVALIASLGAFAASLSRHNEILVGVAAFLSITTLHNNSLMSVGAFLPSIPTHEAITKEFPESIPAAAAKAWLKEHVQSGEVVVSLRDHFNYYYQHLPLFGALQHSELNWALSRVRSPTEALFVLRRFGARYALDAHEYFLHTMYDSETAARPTELIRALLIFAPDSVVYRAHQGRVIDLRLLEDRVMQSCTVESNQLIQPVPAYVFEAADHS